MRDQMVPLTSPLSKVIGLLCVFTQCCALWCCLDLSKRLIKFVVSLFYFETPLPKERSTQVTSTELFFLHAMRQAAQKAVTVGSSSVPFTWTRIRNRLKPPWNHLWSHRDFNLESANSIRCFHDTVSIRSAFNPITCGPCNQTHWRNLQAVVELEASYLGVVGRLLNDFGSHPERCPHKRLPLDLRVRQLTSHAKVSQLHLAMLRQQHVGSLRELLSVCQIIVTISSYEDLNQTRSKNFDFKATKNVVIHSDVCLQHKDTFICILMYHDYHCCHYLRHNQGSPGFFLFFYFTTRWH